MSTVVTTKRTREASIDDRVEAVDWTDVSASSISSRARPTINSFAKRASVIACSSIRTAITRNTPRRYGNGESSG